MKRQEPPRKKKLAASMLTVKKPLVTLEGYELEADEKAEIPEK